MFKLLAKRRSRTGLFSVLQRHWCDSKTNGKSVLKTIMKEKLTIVSLANLASISCSAAFASAGKREKWKLSPISEKINENGRNKPRKAINLCMMYDMQIGAKQTIMKRSPIVDSFLASASPIRASLLTCKITSLSLCRFLFTVWQKENGWRPVPSLSDQDCANSPPRHWFPGKRLFHRGIKTNEQKSTITTTTALLEASSFASPRWMLMLLSSTTIPSNPVH